MSNLLPTGLYVLTPSHDDDDWLACAALAAIRGGAKTLQYRHKTATWVKSKQQARRLATLCWETGTLFVINDSVALAKEIQRDAKGQHLGVHLGKNDVAPSQARQHLGPSITIGVSCYNDWAYGTCVQHASDYIAFGSIFRSQTKPDAKRAPLSWLRNRPIASLNCCVAIGGINEANIRAVWNTGVSAIAVSHAVFGDGRGDPSLCEQKARALSTELLSPR